MLRNASLVCLFICLVCMSAPAAQTKRSLTDLIADLRKGEKERLEREEFEQKGFVADLERLLLAADESANARFASYISGLLAGRRGLPPILGSSLASSVWLPELSPGLVRKARNGGFSSRPRNTCRLIVVS